VKMVQGDCNGERMDPLVTGAVCIYCDHNDSWRSSVAAILGEDVAFTRPSLQCVDRIQRMSLYTTREEVEVTESDTGQHSEKVQHRSPSVELDE
jgi:hypothetical protein